MKAIMAVNGGFGGGIIGIVAAAIGGNLGISSAGEMKLAAAIWRQSMYSGESCGMASRRIFRKSAMASAKASGVSAWLISAEEKWRKRRGVSAGEEK